MSLMRLSEAARLLDGRLIGADASFASVGTDSRSLREGDLFIALRGPHFDAHDYVAEAGARGAVAALVGRACDADLPQLVVADTRLALGRLAALWRERHNIPVIGVTGSNGKTTVKEMLASILGRRGPVLATCGNLNNDIGVPMTLLRLRPQHRWAVIEMGANRAGDVAYATRLARPTVALITNAGPAHLEGFGDVAGVARAKGEIYTGLAEGGAAVINADDVHHALWASLAGARHVIHFGMHAPAEVFTRVQEVRIALEEGPGCMEFPLRTPEGEVQIALPLPGQHNVMNALAAAAAALVAGASLADVKEGLECMQPVSGRLQLRVAQTGAHIIDDTYNANPASLQAGLQVLGAFSGERWLVLGDMVELGEDSGRLHEQVGGQAAALGIDRLYATGELSRRAVQGFGSDARHYPEMQALIEALRADLHAGVTLLVKGSRRMRMEQVVEALQDMAGEHAREPGAAHG